MFGINYIQCLLQILKQHTLVYMNTVVSLLVATLNGAHPLYYHRPDIFDTATKNAFTSLSRQRQPL